MKLRKSAIGLLALGAVRLEHTLVLPGFGD